MKNTHVYFIFEKIKMRSHELKPFKLETDEERQYDILRSVIFYQVNLN